MKKAFSFIAFATLLLAGCSQDDYVGATVDTASATDGAEISFGSLKGNVTRSEQTGSTAAATLGGVFKVYGTKTVGSDVSNVFAQSTTTDGISDGDTYYVWWNGESSSSTSNTKGWEYVGSSGTITPAESTGSEFTLSSDQTIKYWDYSASQYDFIAYANTQGATISEGSITSEGFTVTGGSTEIAGLYLADSVQVVKSKFGEVVKFTFRCAAAKVRLGIYETVPGYSVTNMTFYYGSSSSDSEAYLDGSFVGSTTSQKYTVSYDADGKAVLTPDAAASTSNYFNFGSFNASSGLGTSSTDPTWAGESTDNYYTAAIPNTTKVGEMTLKVDYVLINETSGETINIYGATATVPAAYMKWQSNYAYTYLFKISDNTNGTTGEEDDPTGLYPITFDACVITEADGADYGTITTVSSPSITTFQNGSVVDNGITYTTSDSIYVTVYDNDTEALVSLSDSNLKLYSVDSGTTEAELEAGTATTTATSGLSFPTQDATVNGQTLTTGYYAAINVSSTGTYAVQYINGNDYYYKVIEVESASE